MNQNNPSHANFNILSNTNSFMKEQQISYNTYDDFSFLATEKDVCVPPYTPYTPTDPTDYEQPTPSNEYNNLMQPYPTYEPHHNVNEQNYSQIHPNLIQNVHDISQTNHPDIFRFKIPGFEIIIRPNNNLDMQNYPQDQTTYWNSSLVNQKFQRYQQFPQFPEFQQQQQFSQFQDSPDMNNSNELIPITNNNINF
jgi:hypothetical protein